MRSARMIFSLITVPAFAACGYTSEYQGRVVDEAGVAQSGLAVTLRDVGFAERRYTDADVIGRAEVKETVSTDEQGRFTLQHTYGGSFGCGIEFAPALVIAPEGPTGAVAVALGVEDANHRVDVGTIRLLGALDAVADERGVYVALPADHPSGVVRVDGTSWLLGEDGVLPSAALEPIEGLAKHELTYVAQEQQVHLRSAPTYVMATAPTPRLTAQARDDGSLDARPIDPIPSPEIFIDGVYRDDQLTATSLPAPSLAISIASDPQGSRLAPLPPGACAVYGAGLRCTPSAATLSAVHVDGAYGGRLRVYSR